MKLALKILLLSAIMSTESFSQEKLSYNDLSKQESSVINNKGTEMPFTGKYTNFYEKGTYVCKMRTALFMSSSSLSPTAVGQALMMK
jgi:peptide methionine sulfoxide reductase MsrB